MKASHVCCGKCWGACASCATCLRLTNERKSAGFRPAELLAASLTIAGFALLAVIVGVWV